MGVPFKHIVHQGKTLATLGDVLYLGLRQQLGVALTGDGGGLPSPPQEALVPPRPPALVRDYIRHVGGSPSAYGRTIPAHMFPQWSFPVAEKTQRTVDYPLFKMVNGGCRLEINGPLPADETLRVSARLEDIDDDGRRAILHQRVATGTTDEPELVVAHIYEVVALGGGGARARGEKKQAKERPRVPRDAREIGDWRLRRDDGLTFALLTGDFNPLHWLPAYARAFGFRSTILHGFATMARAIEGLNRAVFSGDVTRLSLFDARFTKPLVLPARVGLYVKERDVWVGDAPGGPAYLVGSFAAQDDRQSEESGR